MSDLRWTVDGSRVVLTGEITERTDFRPLLALLAQEATLVLDGVTRINSCGVREWIYFVRDAEKAGKALTLERCAIPFVHQMNMISNFVGRSRVASVMAPYLCPRCGKDAAGPIDLSPSAGPLPEAATRQIRALHPCPKCKAPMEFDDLEEVYFAFLEPS